MISKEVLEKIFYKMPYISKRIDISCYMNDFFDKQVSKRISPCEIFVGWSGFSLYTLRKIRKSFPTKTIIERGSFHIETQRDILSEEQDMLGIKLELPSQDVVDKELAEYQETDYIEVPSNLAKESFIKKGFKESKLIYTPLGVDINTFQPGPKNDSLFRIIFIGMAVRKGVHYLLEAASQLKIKGLEVLLVGRIDDEVKPVLKKYSGAFKVIGVIAHKDLQKYYSRSSCYVLLSLEDGFAMTVLEAMACGIPVICSDKVGAKDIVREGIDGFIIPARDREKLKDRILYLYENPRISEAMGREARKRVESNFTWSHYGERIINIYRGILN